MDWLDNLATTLSPTQLAEARRRESENARGEDYLLDSGLVTPERVLAAKSKAQRLPHLTLEGYHPDPESLALVTSEQARRLLLLPLFTLDGKLYVALTDPNNLDAQDFVRKRTGMRVESVLVQRPDLQRAFDRFYPPDGAAPAPLEPALAPPAPALVTPAPPPAVAPPPVLAPPPPPPRPAAPPASLPNTSSLPPTAPVALPPPLPPAPSPPPPRAPNAPLQAPLWEPIIGQAMGLGASDVHLAPTREGAQLRVRVDGQLEDHSGLLAGNQAALMAQLRPAGPLGHIRWTISQRVCDARLSLVQSLHGEALHLRLHSTPLSEWAALGMDPRTSSRMDALLRQPRGLILICGIAGAGKSTSLHLALTRTSGLSRKVLLLEHPLERELAGVLQVDPEQSAAALLQDADVLAWAELDEVTAARRMLGYCGGRLVLAAVSATSIQDALQRIVDMQVAPSRLLINLKAVLHQRLMRRLCQSCRAKVEPAPTAELQAMGVKGLPPGVTLYGPRGCPDCRNTGYRGRIGIFELLEVSHELRASGLAPDALVRQAESAGHMALRHAAIGKLLSGHTSLEEIKACLEE